MSSLIADGETVLLDSGTTCLEVARLLRQRPVTVMPLSLQAIHLLGDAPGPATLMVPGGQPRAAEGALTGPLTLASLAALRFDTAVIGCCGLSAAEGPAARRGVPHPPIPSGKTSSATSNAASSPSAPAPAPTEPSASTNTLACAAHCFRPDPAQRGRLVEIRDNLLDRIAKAEWDGWLGEIEGLQVSLAGAQSKISQIDRASRTGPVMLGMPAREPA